MLDQIGHYAVVVRELSPGRCTGPAYHYLWDHVVPPDVLRAGERSNVNIEQKLSNDQMLFRALYMHVCLQTLYNVYMVATL